MVAAALVSSAPLLQLLPAASVLSLLSPLPLLLMLRLLLLLPPPPPLLWTARADQQWPTLFARARTHAKCLGLEIARICPQTLRPTKN